MTLRLITAGESHGPGLTCIVEGLPAGIALRPEDLNEDMSRRQLGHGRGGRMKIERDAAEVTGGVRHGRTLGSPVALRVDNRDFANWEQRMSPWPVQERVEEVHLPRPGHADLVGTLKYKQTDVRNVLERASARETAARVAGGGLCKAFLRALGVQVRSHVIQIASVHAPPPAAPLTLEDFAQVDSSPVRCLDAGRQGDGGRDRQAAQGQRVARRRVRGAGLRPAARAWVARLLGRAAGRAPGDGDLLDPGDQGRLDRRRLHRRRAAGLAGPRRDPVLRAARLLPRDQPRRRAGGRDDRRPTADRARCDEAAAHAHPAAALGRHRDPRAARPCASAPTRPPCRPPRSSARRWSRSSSRTPTGASSAAITSTTCSRPSAHTKNGSDARSS